MKETLHHTQHRQNIARREIERGRERMKQKENEEEEKSTNDYGRHQ